MNLWYLNFFLLGLLVIWGAYEGYLRIMAKRSATWLNQDEFREGLRKAQVIDVRQKDTFDAGHILGARNLPYTMIKDKSYRQQYIDSLRKDQPIYIYDQRKALSIRMANQLRKAGFKNLFLLKEGYDGWEGKVKKKKNV
ncbi:rhodanese-like domain-containing protein [Enterococcus sp. LJL120]